MVKAKSITLSVKPVFCRRFELITYVVTLILLGIIIAMNLTVKNWCAVSGFVLAAMFAIRSRRCEEVNDEIVDVLCGIMLPDRKKETDEREV